MKFYELQSGDMFTFHSFSNEVWQKVGDAKCVCLSYADSELDEPMSLKDNVFPVDYMKDTKDIYGYKKGTEYPVSPFQAVEITDKFQPMSLIKQLRRYIKEVTDNPTTDERMKEGIRLGLAWAIAEILEQATAKDRYTPTEDTGYPGMDKATEQHLMEHNG